MRSITVVDRPLCCSSGVCGPEPDPTLVRFAEDLKWLAGKGVAVGRINPSADPEAFLAQIAVMRVFEARGNACLPAVLADGRIVSSGHYPERDQLARYAELDDARDGLVTPAVGELVAIGAAIAANCEPCFRFHYAEALKLGVARADMTQVVTIAQTVKDSPAQAILDLADRYLNARPLDHSADQPAGCCGSAATAPSDAGASAAAPGCCC
jgi:AhpD family alkylhydroperoxidase